MVWLGFHCGAHAETASTRHVDHLVRLLTGKDIAKINSGNVGSRNAGRVLGAKGFLITFVGDFGKGLLVVLLVDQFSSELWVLLTALIAVTAGHIWPIQLHFKGGKGVATALGVVLGLDILLGMILIGIWGLTVLWFKYSSGGALVSFGLLPVIVLFTSQSNNFLIFSVLVTVCIFWRHHSNIINLVRGTESKVDNLTS